MGRGGSRAAGTGEWGGHPRAQHTLMFRGACIYNRASAETSVTQNWSAGGQMSVSLFVWKWVWGHMGGRRRVGSEGRCGDEGGFRGALKLCHSGVIGGGWHARGLDLARVPLKPVGAGAAALLDHHVLAGAHHALVALRRVGLKCGESGVRRQRGQRGRRAQLGGWR